MLRGGTKDVLNEIERNLQVLYCMHCIYMFIVLYVSYWL